MGLRDINGSTDENNSGSKRRAVSIDISEMEHFFDERPEKWRKDIDVQALEIVFKCVDFAPDLDNLKLQCWTTIDKRTMKSRSKGEDAIRLSVYDKEKQLMVSGKKKTLRIKTWRKNLNRKIDEVLDDINNIIELCPQCDGYLIKKEGRYGGFLGCNNYPECDHTEDV